MPSAHRPLTHSLSLRVAWFLLAPLLLAAFTLTAAPARCASIERLPPASGVSADGSIVVGDSSNSAGNQEAFRWIGGTMTGLGFLADTGHHLFSIASGVSADGSIVVGYSFNNAGNQEAFRWVSDGTPTGGTMTGLGFLDDTGHHLFSIASGVSADGSIVVGYSFNNAGDHEAFRWIGGTMTGLGFLDDTGHYLSSSASGVSADGSIVVGYSFNNACDQEAFRWIGGTMTGLGFLDDTGHYLSSSASGVSADGSIVVGYSFNNAGDHEAFRWVSDGTPTGGTMTGLGFLADTGHYLSSASGVSADGSVVVGYSDTNIMVPAAFLWTEGTGMVSLASVLQNAGVDLTGWTLSTATGVSGDGNIIVGVDEYQSVGFIANVTAGGLITPEALNQSLGAMGQVGPAVSGMGQLSMSRLGGVAGGQGAHVRVAGGPGGHEQGLAGGDETPGRLDLWAVGSLGSNVELNGDDLGLHGGLGLSWDNGGEWRFGGGLFADSRDLDTDYHGNQDIQAVGPGVFVAYRPEDTGLEFRVSSLWQSVDLDLKRGYLNGAGYAASSGSTNAEVFGISGRAQWTKPVTGSLDLTPFAEYTWQTCHIDGYSESDGPFPASYDSRTEESNSIRTGLRADLALFEDLGLWTWGAWNHRFEDSSSGLGGTATGLGAFSYSGATLDQDWADLGVGLTRRFSDRLTTTFSLGGALGCDDDSVPDLTATVGFSYQLW